MRCMWLQIHGVMDDMVKDDISSNGTIHAAFVRFLTKQIAANVAAGGGKADPWKAKLDDEVKKFGQVAANSLTAATEAKSVGKSAHTLATMVKEDMKSLFVKNKELKK